jgi:DNA-binding NtrC family response regulator
MSTILLVNLGEETRKEVVNYLQKGGYILFAASSHKKAIEIVKQREIDLAIVGHKLPKGNGLEFSNILLRQDDSLSVILISGEAELKDAISAIKNGASDFLITPLKHLEFKKAVTRALENKKLIVENLRLKKALENYTKVKLIGTSPLFQKVVAQVQQVAPTRSTVLITGESGTGKELVAEAVHSLSPRIGKPLVKVNCGALTESLLESELFGHEKGAFTGASFQRKGRFEMAHLGTLFLDEIGEMTPAMQVKLLRVLETGEFERVGGDRAIKVDVRVIVATNRNLDDLVNAGSFRSDLYYRLNVFTVEMPPLRERVEDITLLAQYFLQHFAKENNKDIKGFTPEVEKLLISYHWSGNIRELKNVMERAVILAKDPYIQITELPPKLRLAQTPPDLILMPIGSSIDEIEREAIRKTLLYTKGDKSSAARILGVGLATLYRKLNHIK